MPPARQIKSPIQLLVEGNDQRNFFEAFLSQLSLPNVQVQNFGGVDELRGFLSAFVVMPNFPNVQSVGIIRDAEKSAIGAFQSVQTSLQNVGLPVPNDPGIRVGDSPAVTALILPCQSRHGMLETLLCDTFAATSLDRCIDDFFDCAQSLPGISVNKSDKARARAYILTKPEAHVSVGVAAQKGYWDLQHNSLGHVRNFLRQL